MEPVQLLRKLFGFDPPARPAAPAAPANTQAAAPEVKPARIEVNAQTAFAPATAAEKQQAQAKTDGTVQGDQAASAAAGKGPAKAGQTSLLGFLAAGSAPLEERIANVRDAKDLGEAVKLLGKLPELGKAAKRDAVLASYVHQKDQGAAMIDWAMGNTRDSPLATNHTLYVTEGKGGAVELHVRIDDRYLSAGNMDDQFSYKSDRRDVKVESNTRLADLLPGLTPTQLADAASKLIPR